MRNYSDRLDFEVSWLPFLLSPDAPVEGVDKRTFYKQKIGPRYQTMVDHLRAVGEEVGINFSQDGIIGNTINSHILIEFAKHKGKQDEVVEQLFKIYFEEGRNLAEEATLTAAAGRAGLDPADVSAALSPSENSARRDRVISSDRSAKRRGDVSGVPFFSFNDKAQFSGAQDVSVFERVFQRFCDSKL